MVELCAINLKRCVAWNGRKGFQSFRFLQQRRFHWLRSNSLQLIKRVNSMNSCKVYDRLINKKKAIQIIGSRLIPLNWWKDNKTSISKNKSNLIRLLKNIAFIKLLNSNSVRSKKSVCSSSQKPCHSVWILLKEAIFDSIENHLSLNRQRLIASNSGKLSEFVRICLRSRFRQNVHNLWQKKIECQNARNGPTPSSWWKKSFSTNCQQFVEIPSFFCKSLTKSGGSKILPISSFSCELTKWSLFHERDRLTLFKRVYGRLTNRPLWMIKWTIFVNNLI